MDKKRVLWSMLGVLMAVGIVLGGAESAFAEAQGHSPIARLSPVAFDSYLSFKGLCYGVAGIATLGAGAVAMGTGRMPFKWLTALVLSLVMASGGGDLIGYVTGANL